METEVVFFYNKLLERAVVYDSVLICSQRQCIKAIINNSGKHFPKSLKIEVLHSEVPHKPLTLLVLTTESVSSTSFIALVTTPANSFIALVTTPANSFIALAESGREGGGGGS